PIRAAHDPPLNQGAPDTAAALRDVVLRRQYDVASLWPRQAPIWLQLGNIFEYADWQAALGLARGPVPTVPRLAVSLLFVSIAIVGAAAHRKRNPVGWCAVLLLVLAGGPGAVVQLNLKAGPSYGHGVLAEDAPREARERDYFFVLAFTGWGLWAGIGAVALARRAGRAPVRYAALSLPLVPAALNASAVNGRPMPDAALARDFGESLLLSAPRNAILLTAGDNDSYPLWYLQMVEGTRTDVLVLPLPLLPAQWFREELARRDGLDTGGRQGTEEQRLSRLARSAAAMDRPVAVSPNIRELGMPLRDSADLVPRGVVRVLVPRSRPRAREPR